MRIENVTRFINNLLKENNSQAKTKLPTMSFQYFQAKGRTKIPKYIVAKEQGQESNYSKN